MKFPLTLSISGLLFCFSAGAEAKEDLSDALQALGIKAELPGKFFVNYRSSRKGTELTFTELFAKDEKGSRLEAEVVAPLEMHAAGELARNRLLVLEGSYGKRPTPYVGEITNTSICPKKFQPKRTETGSAVALATALTGRVSERGLWGNCAPGGKAWDGTVAFYYDAPQKRMLRVQLLRAPKAMPEKNVKLLFSGIKFGP